MTIREAENAKYRDIAARVVWDAISAELPAGSIDPKTLEVTLNRIPFRDRDVFYAQIRRRLLETRIVNSDVERVPATWWDHAKVTYRKWLSTRLYWATGPRRAMLRPLKTTFPRTVNTREIHKTTGICHQCPHLETWLTPGQEHLKWMATYPGEPCTGVYPDQPPRKDT